MVWRKCRVCGIENTADEGNANVTLVAEWVQSLFQVATWTFQAVFIYPLAA